MAHGRFEEEAVDALHSHMRALLAAQGALLDHVRYCPHHPKAERAQYRKACSWRKPQAGIILDLAKSRSIDLTHPFPIGDKQSDLEAVRAAPVRSFLYREGPLELFVTDVISHMAEVARRVMRTACAAGGPV